ncbi:TRAP-type C4-dicarboxylate transport system permease small subunit [Variovorax paradoxus]|nr:TRAP-type C4-dicarboxylate transport system permease small subunit [Variovorax paradoxus]
MLYLAGLRPSLPPFSLMSLLDLLNHLLNFVAPALAVGFLCALMGRVFVRRAAGVPSWWIQGAINAGVGALVLLGGLVFFGRDGAMATYAALVLACGTSQWWVSGAWRG